MIFLFRQITDAKATISSIAVFTAAFPFNVLLHYFEYGMHINNAWFKNWECGLSLTVSGSQRG